MKRFVVILLLIIVSLSVRLYQLTKHTEFLGDQGRDALAVREFIQAKKLPVVGPTVGAGHYTGPFYYYLIAPSFGMFESSPIAGAVEMIIISVAAIILFLIVAFSFFNFPIAYGVSVLWALSPFMIMQDRRLWNPTPVPFFVLLLIASLVWIAKKKYWAFLTAAFASAALIQLHYVNGISLLLAGCCLVGITYTLLKEGKGKSLMPWFVASVGLFAALLYPFISYEVQHGFKDITGSWMTLSFKDGQVFSKRLYMNTYIDICARLASYIIAIPWKTPLVVIAVYLCIGNVIKKNTISYVLVAWYGIGIACLSFYKDTFQPQYAYQFIPVTFFLLAGTIHGLRKWVTVPLIVGFITVVTLISWLFYNPYSIKDPDIPRIQGLTDSVIAKVDNKPFAFTIMNSRSFADFHVRYFFVLKHATVIPVDDRNGKRLFILCEGACPKGKLVGNVSVMCHTELCPLDKPDIPLDEWVYVSTTEVGSSAIYSYER